jgi:hypothetical protein
MRVVAGVLVDREDLEAQLQPAEVLGRTPDRDSNRLLVIPEGQNDGDIEPGTVGHRA